MGIVVILQLHPFSTDNSPEIVACSPRSHGSSFFFEPGKFSQDDAEFREILCPPDKDPQMVHIQNHHVLIAQFAHKSQIQPKTRCTLNCMIFPEINPSN